MTDSASWPERHAAAASAWDTTPNPFVAAVCRRLRPGVALDLGAGDGANAIWLAGRGWRVTAVDRESVAVGRIQSRSAVLAHPVDAIIADAVDYRPRPGSFDLILLSYLELPEPQRRRVLTHCAHGLAEGGLLLVVGQDATNLDAGWGSRIDPDLLTTSTHLADVLAGHGLTVRRAEVVRREVPGEIGFHIALDHIVEAVWPAA